MSVNSGLLINKEDEAARVITDAIHAVYVVGMRMKLSPAMVARLMIVDASIQMFAANKHGDIPLIVIDAIKRAGAQ